MKLFTALAVLLAVFAEHGCEDWDCTVGCTTSGTSCDANNVCTTTTKECDLDGICKTTTTTDTDSGNTDNGNTDSGSGSGSGSGSEKNCDASNPDCCDEVDVNGGNCDYWANKMGYCNKQDYAVWINKACPVTCKSCPDPNPNPDCMDTKPNECKFQYEPHGDCGATHLKAQMMSECKKTCQMCKWKGPCAIRLAGVDNTMCRYKKKMPGPDCGDLKKVKRNKKGLPDKYQTIILDTHNQLRQKVAAGEQKGLPAGSIPDLKWDNGLAKVAQRWMNQCKYKHDQNRVTAKFPGWVGQNLYVSYWPLENGSPAPTVNETLFADAVNLWYAEVQDFTNKGCTPTTWSTCLGDNPGKSVMKEWKDIEEYNRPEAEIGHFTQVIWAESTHVGCGWVRFENGGNDRIETIVACNYGPGGNMGGDPIYQ